MTEHQLKEFLEENKADIQAAVKKATIERLLEQHRWNFSEQIHVVVNEFVAAEIVPAVQAALADQKGALVDAAVAGIAAISDGLAKGLAADAAKKIGDEWTRKKILKEIFGY